MNSKNSTINLAVPVSGLEEWIQSRITEAIKEATNTDKQAKKYVSQKELGTHLGFSPPTVIALRKKGIIRGVLVGNKWRYEVSEVWEQLRSHQEKQAEKFAPIKRNGRA
jgi:hypothetical protein